MTDQYTPNQPIADAYTTPQAEAQPVAQPAVPSEPAAAPAPAPTRLNAAALRNRKRREQEGYDFILRATTDEDGNPTVARVRRPDIFDADELAKLPDHMQTAIFALIEEAEREEGKPQGPGVEQGVVELLKRNYGAFSTMTDAYVIAGFIEPRVYATAAEADANGGVWVKDIERADRIAFYHHCTGLWREATDELGSFRERPDDALDAGPTGEAVSGQPAQLLDWPAGATGAPGV